MTIKECQPLVEGIKAEFCEKMGCSITPEVVLLTKAATKTKRTAVFQFCGAKYFEYLPSTSGETVAGRNGIVVLIYPNAIRNPHEFRLVLLHELGHAFFNQTNKELLQKLETVYDVNEPGGMAKFGLSHWNEFIAQCIANIVAEEEPQQIAWPRQEQLFQLLKEAFPGIDDSNTRNAQLLRQTYFEGYKVIQYKLAHYCAMLLTDPTLIWAMEREPMMDRGFDMLTDREIQCLEDILVCLDEQIIKDDYWMVTEPWLEGLGILVNRLWDCR